MHVNIYIETSFTGPAARRAAGAWIVEYIKASGAIETRGGIMYADKTMENELALYLIIRSVSILTKTCCVRVSTGCRHVLNTMNNHWLPQWQKNSWVNAKGKMVKNAEAWNKCAGLFGKHMMEWTDGCHEYRTCMYRCVTDPETGEKYGWGRVLDYIGVGWEDIPPVQMTLFDFTEVMP